MTQQRRTHSTPRELVQKFKSWLDPAESRSQDAVVACMAHGKPSACSMGRLLGGLSDGDRDLDGHEELPAFSCCHEESILLFFFFFLREAPNTKSKNI